MVKKQRPPKVEILFEISLDGGRIKECDFIDYMNGVHEASQHLDSKIAIVKVPEITSIFGGAITYYVVYRKLAGVKRVTTRDLRRAIKALVDPDDEMGKPPPEKNKNLVVSVKGGTVIDVSGIPKGVQVEIRDYDIEGVGPKDCTTDDAGDRYVEATYSA